jgi:hypothetical protein
MLSREKKNYQKNYREKLEKRKKMRETYTSIPKVVVIYLLPHLHRMNIVRS